MASVKVRASLLRVGQTVSRPVFDDNGLLLVGEGSEVDERILSLLRAAGIRWVEVENGGSVFPWQIWRDPPELKKESSRRFGNAGDRYTKAIERAIATHLDKIKE